MEKWTVVLVLHVGWLCHAALCSPPRPVDVFFYSINLQNVLQWRPGNNMQPNTNFTVQYAIYGDREKTRRGRRLRWGVVPQCRHIALTRCDLTNQTWDLEQRYYARVRAVGKSGFSNWTTTRQRFDPKTDTVVGPPLVTLEMKEHNAVISIEAPMRYRPDNHKPKMSIVEVYPWITFNLSIRIAGGNNLTHHILLSSRRLVYRLMDYDKEYCFSAQAKLISIPVQCQPSAWQCIKTPQDPMIGQLTNIIVGIGVPLLCICMLGVGGYFIHYLLWGKKDKWPDALKLRHHHSALLTFSPVDFVLMDKLWPFGKPCTPDVHPYKPHPLIGPLPDLLSYAPQGSPPPEPDQPSEGGCDSGGVTYGFVGGAPDMGGQEGLEEPREGLGNGDEGGGGGRREEEKEEQEEKEEYAGRILWDPESGVFMLPETPQWGEGGLDGWMLGVREPESGGDEEEAEEMGAEEGREGVRLENVFVRQGSEQEREAARQRECETDTLLVNWNLVVNMDE